MRHQRWIVPILALGLAGVACADAGPDPPDPAGFARWLADRRRGDPPLDHRRVAIASAAPATPRAVAAGPTWTALGPTPVANVRLVGGQRGRASGRVVSIAPHPTNTQIAYLGAAHGGVWRTSDGGASWTPLTDKQPSLAIGALAIDPTNPNIIYAGTGEGFTAANCLNFYGVGLLKSTDGGATWSLKTHPSFDRRAITSIVIDRTTPTTLYVTTSRGNADTRTISCGGVPGAPLFGLLRSTDGGETFTLLQVSITGVTTVLQDPTAPLVLYAAVDFAGVFKSVNGGVTFVKLLGGLPAVVRRTELAMDPAAPATLYASFDDGASTTVFRTIDSGTTWTELAAARGYCSNQCSNTMTIAAGGTGTVFAAGVDQFLRSTDFGATFTNVITSGEPMFFFNQSIAFHPSTPSVVWAGNEGGIWRSTDGGATWANRNNDLALASFLSVATHPTDPDVILGGANLLGTLLHRTGTTWTSVRSGNAGAAAIDPAAPSTFYRASRGNRVERSDDSGTTWACKVTETDVLQAAVPGCFELTERRGFAIPLVLDSARSSTVYLGTFRVHRATNRGDTFVPVSPDLTTGVTATYITAIAPAPSASSTVYAATVDGLAWVTRDSAATWSLAVAGLPVGRTFSALAVDENDSARAYLTVTGFGTGHVFRTTNAGANWTDISGNLPDVPVDAVLAVDASTLVAGTDIGVFVTRDGGSTWTLTDEGFPRAAVFGLSASRQTNRIVAATLGRGMLANQLFPTLSVQAPADGVRLGPGSSVDVSWTAADGLVRASIAPYDISGLMAQIVGTYMFEL
jgi:photosystem II stability/assembly factor-like uncharacterized protein